jgi:hypothetical protein
MAVLRQERHVELVPGAAEAFLVTNEMYSAVIPDQLPHLNIFVIAVADALDPKQDTLARVANIADLSLLPIGRDAGIVSPGPNGIEFLSQTSTSSYSTLETANDAAVAFQDRVNALIEGWISFRTEFNAPDPTPAEYVLPRVDASQKQALINAYAAAKQNGYTQLQLKNAADATLLVVQADYTYKQSLLPGVATIFTDATKVQGELASVITQFGTLLSAGSTFYAANTGGAGAATFAAALATATAQQAAMPGYNTDANTLIADVTAYQTARLNDVATAATAVATAQSNQITQTQLLTAANATTAAALAAVLAVCPDFDSTSIPYVPG